MLWLQKTGHAWLISSAKLLCSRKQQKMWHCTRHREEGVFDMGMVKGGTKKQVLALEFLV